MKAITISSYKRFYKERKLFYAVMKEKKRILRINALNRMFSSNNDIIVDYIINFSYVHI